MKPSNGVDVMAARALRELSRRSPGTVPRPVITGRKFKVVTFVRGDSYADGRPPGVAPEAALADTLNLYIELLGRSRGLGLTNASVGRGWPTVPTDAAVFAHLDPHPSNFAYANGRAAGLFDFDFVAPCSLGFALAAFTYHWTPFVPDDVSPFPSECDKRKERLEIILGIGASGGISRSDISSEIPTYLEWRLDAIRWHSSSSEPLRKWLGENEHKARSECHDLVKALL